MVDLAISIVAFVVVAYAAVIVVLGTYSAIGLSMMVPFAAARAIRRRFPVLERGYGLAIVMILVAFVLLAL